MPTNGIIWFLLVASLALIAAATGCSSSDESSTPGLLEQYNVKGAADIEFAVVNMADGGGGSFRIADRPTLGRVYQFLNEAERVSGMVKLWRPDEVVLVGRSGRTLSFVFSLENPNLTQSYRSIPFVEFVKNEVMHDPKYLNKERIPLFSIKQAARIVGQTSRAVLPASTIVNVQADVRLLASAYKPYACLTEQSKWDTIAAMCIIGSPGLEATLTAPVRFRTLVGRTKRGTTVGSTALKLVTLNVDRIVVYVGENRQPQLAFHSGKTWYAAGLNPKAIRGRTLKGVYDQLMAE